MPITDELRSINRLEAAGFTHDQAKAIVEVTEDGVQSGFEKFVEVLDRKTTELELRLKADMQGLRADLLKDQRDQMIRFAALVSVIGAVIGAALKWL